MHWEGGEGAVVTIYHFAQKKNLTGVCSEEKVITTCIVLCILSTTLVSLQLRGNHAELYDFYAMIMYCSFSQGKKNETFITIHFHTA